MTNDRIKDILGYSAAFCLVITLLPQLYFTWKTKKAYDISYGFLCLQIITCLLFLSYGVFLEEIPLIIANSMVTTQSISLFIMKIVYSKNDKIKISNTEI